MGKTRFLSLKLRIKWVFYLWKKKSASDGAPPHLIHLSLSSLSLSSPSAFSLSLSLSLSLFLFSWFKTKMVVQWWWFPFAMHTPEQGDQRAPKWLEPTWRSYRRQRLGVARCTWKPRLLGIRMTADGQFRQWFLAPKNSAQPPLHDGTSGFRWDCPSHWHVIFV